MENYLEDPAHNDFADIEGDTQPLAQVRKEMIDLAFEQSPTQVSLNNKQTKQKKLTFSDSMGSTANSCKFTPLGLDGDFT